MVEEIRVIGKVRRALNIPVVMLVMVLMVMVMVMVIGRKIHGDRWTKPEKNKPAAVMAATATAAFV